MRIRLSGYPKKAMMLAPEPKADETMIPTDCIPKIRNSISVCYFVQLCKSTELELTKKELRQLYDQVSEMDYHRAINELKRLNYIEVCNVS